MGNTPKRPSTARKHTRTTESKREKELDQGVRITYDGQVYEVRAGDLTALDVMALRRETGMSFAQLISTPDPDIDTLAAIIWLARRTSGEQMLRFATVAQGINYDDAAAGFDQAGDLGEEPPGESRNAGD